MENSIDVLVKGGILMIPICLLSVYTAAIIIYKILQFRKSKALDFSCVEAALVHLKKGEPEKAEKDFAKNHGPLGVMSALLIKQLRKDEFNEAEVERVGILELRKLEAHQRGLGQRKQPCHSRGA